MAGRGEEVLRRGQVGRLPTVLFGQERRVQVGAEGLSRRNGFLHLFAAPTGNGAVFKINTIAIIILLLRYVCVADK